MNGRDPDYYINNGNKKIPIFKTPFTRSDFNFIVNQDGGGERFGIHDGQSGKIKFYELGNGHIPYFNNIFNMDMDFSFYKASKVIGLGVVMYWAYRLSTIKPPRNPLRTTEKTKEFLDELFVKSKRPNPDVIHMGQGNGFKEAE